MKKDILIGGVFVALAILGVGAVVIVLGSREDPAIANTIKPKPEPIAVLPQAVAATQQEKKKAAETIRKIPIQPIQVEPDKKKATEATNLVKRESEGKNEVKAPATKSEGVKPGPPPEKKPAQPLVNSPDVIELGSIKKINRPAGGYAVEQLDGDEDITLLGKVKTLTISGGVKGRSTFDASALEAQEIIVTGDITGSARLKLLAPKGSVVFHSLLSGNAQVEVEAPEGKIVLKSSGPLIATAGAHLTLVARDVELNGAIDGGVQVKVTLTTGGSLKFRKLLGGARLGYAKANARDPEPRLDRGEILGGAEVRKLEPPRR